MRLHQSVLIMIIIAVVTAGGWFSLLPKEHRHQQVIKDVYYCPMHPSYTSDRPGKCPICNMELVMRKRQDAQSKSPIKNDDMHNHEKGVDGYLSVRLDNRQRQLMDVRTVSVKKQTVTKLVHAVGYVAHDIELYKIQNEFIEAYQAYVTIYRDYRRINTRRRNWEVHRNLQTKVLESEHRLVMLGLGQAQIDRLRNIKWWQSWDQPDLEIYRKNNNYWIFAQIFERDLGFVEVGQKTMVEVPAFHEKLTGVIRSIGGYIDPETRTVRALIEVSGYRGELMANMLAYVDILSELGEHLVVPRDAVMDLGTRKIVFVDKGEGVFDPVEVKVGFESDGSWAIESGLKAGEKVVASGNFLLDSESRLRAQVNAVDGDLGNGVGHVHN